jgi:hypothetical protein
MCSGWASARVRTADRGFVLYQMPELTGRQLQDPAGAQNHRSLQTVLKLPDIPRPIVKLKNRKDFFRYVADFLVHAPRELADEVAR